MKKIYIAGKVTGLPFEEVTKKFRDAQDNIEVLGFEVVNPITLVNNANCEWKAAMKICIKAMLDCDAVIILSDWYESKGARVERELAWDLNIPIFNYSKNGLAVMVKNLQ
jgi:nucleoside 2-deoxyribosyltransferase